MTEASDKITLTIKGARAERGVSLSDFESFIDNFLAALRDYDRAGRGEPTRRSGHPDRRAEAVTAFRLVGFETGSGIATIEPEFVTVDEDQLPVGDVPLALATLRALADDLAAERTVPQPVLLTSALRGTMAIERIEPVDVEQSTLFTSAPVDEEELLARQGITAAQGLGALADPEWDDETDDAYLAALLSK